MEDGVLMPHALREPLINLIDTRIERSAPDIIGTSASPAYKWFDTTLNQYLWVMDVDLGIDGNRPDATVILKAIAIADASHGVHKAGPGVRLRLRRLETARTYEIVGVASIVNGQVVVVEVTYDTSGVTIGTSQTFGSEYRRLTYAELGTPALNGGYAYGQLPYDTIGKFDAQGNILTVLVAPK